MQTFKWDTFQREAQVRPFVIDGLPAWHPASTEKGGPGSISIPVPSGESFMAAEQAQGVGESLRLLCAEQWPAVEQLVKGGDEVVVNEVTEETARPGHPLPSTALIEFMQAITRHFSVGDDARPPAGGRR